jgi:hypothetical protein
MAFKDLAYEKGGTLRAKKPVTNNQQLNIQNVWVITRMVT